MEKKTALARSLATLAAALALAASLAGCSGGTAENDSGYEPDTKSHAEAAAPVIDEPAATENPQSSGSAETERSQSSGGALDRIRRIKEKQAAQNHAETDKEPEASSVDSAAADMSSAESVARLGELVGNNSLKPSAAYEDGGDTIPYVAVDKAHNPYDLTWRYGEMPEYELYDQTGAYGWDKLYQSYVKESDWSLVFDVEYYKSAFPVLAQLYHNDDELLLEHFQTVGVHEGRQGSAGFNVAAYMEHCSEELRTAFGDNYECYYFYYMLNQDTEKSVGTTGDYKTWQTVDLSWYQNDELEHVNGYRAEVGANPVKVDPEMVAFANLRAWNDAVNDVKAHDSIYDPFVDDAMANLDIDEFFENTTKCHSQTCSLRALASPWLGFRNSTKGHYEAMVNTRQKYFGSSNTYLSTQSGNKSHGEFDMFTPETPRTSR